MGYSGVVEYVVGGVVDQLFVDFGVIVSFYYDQVDILFFLVLVQGGFYFFFQMCGDYGMVVVFQVLGGLIEVFVVIVDFDQMVGCVFEQWVVGE